MVEVANIVQAAQESGGDYGLGIAIAVGGVVLTFFAVVADDVVKRYRRAKRRRPRDVP